MKWLADHIMRHRARSLFRRVRRHLPSTGTIGDLGSGTGHNAHEIRQQTNLSVQEYDVADLHWIGPGPALLTDDRIPADDHSHTALLLLYVLQYPSSVSVVLHEARRVTAGAVIVLQSTYHGRFGLLVLKSREYVWGRLAWQVARRLKLVSSGGQSLTPCGYFTRQSLVDQFQRCGFTVRTICPSRWPFLAVSRDLFVLEAATA